MCQDQSSPIPFQQVLRLTLPTSTVVEAAEEEEEVEAAGEIMTTSEDKEATWASRATSGESTVVGCSLQGCLCGRVCQHRGSYLSFSSNPSRMSRGDPRNIIEYRDLDAPDDMDFF